MPATRTDRLRQLTVTLAALCCGFGTLVGTGVLGTRVGESSGGALAADATHLAPAGPAFSIWWVIYLGLFAYTVLQWFPDRATATRMRRTGWLAAVSMVLNAAWLLVTQAGWLWASVVVIFTLVAVLAVLIRVLQDHPARSRTDRILADGTFGLYLGWVCIAAVANFAATAQVSGVRPPPAAAVNTTVVALIVVAAFVVWLLRALGARWAVAAAAAWGLGWIAVARTVDEPRSAATAIAAVAAALVVLAAVPVLRRRHPATSPEQAGPAAAGRST